MVRTLCEQPSRSVIDNVYEHLDPMIVARRCYVSGRVQGVFYRASTRQKAVELGCAGYARNLPDGRVEVLAIAEAHAVGELIDWLWLGPPAARVSHVEVMEVPIDEVGEIPVGFGTG